jgi:UDP-N-acetylglucosamine:LPS N-acetylglucosamine transferase
MQANKRKIKIVVASVLAGSGHNTAAELFTDVLSKDDRFEISKFIHPTKTLDFTYSQTTKYFPFVFDFMVKHSFFMTADMLMFVYINVIDECIEILKKEKPDILICTQFSLSYAFKVAQIITNIYPTTMLALLDYGRHPRAALPFNSYLKPDYTIVFDESNSKYVQQVIHQKPKYIIISGHKSRKDFIEAKSRFTNKAEARAKLKSEFKGDIYKSISESKNTILIASGGGGTITKSFKLLKKIAKKQRENPSLIKNTQFFIICGQNKKAYNKLYKVNRTKPEWANIFPFSWLNSKQYAQIQFASDYPVLYGIAPATMNELLNTQCGPLIVHKLRAFHEITNVEFMQKNKLGDFIKDDQKLLVKIFKPISKNTVKEFEYNANRIIEHEESKLKLLPDQINEVYLNKKNINIFNIYKTNILQLFISRQFIIIYIIFFQARRFVWWTKLIYRKYFSKDQQN